MMEHNIEKLEKEIQKIEKEKDEFLAGWQRAKADLANYKKEDKERGQQLMEYVRQELLFPMLYVLDNLERAEQELKEEEKDSKLVQGFLQIARQLKEFLKIESNNNQDLDYPREKIPFEKVEKLIKDNLEKTKDVLNKETIHIFIFPTTDKFVINKMNGSGGYSIWKNTIYID